VWKLFLNLRCVCPVALKCNNGERRFKTGGHERDHRGGATAKAVRLWTGLAHNGRKSRGTLEAWHHCGGDGDEEPQE